MLSAVAKQAAGLVKQRELTEEAGKAEAIAQADELRRSLLSAVSHDLRTPLAAAKAAVSSLRSDDIDFSAEDTAELLATIEESIDQLTALVGNLLDSSRLAAGVLRPELRRVYLEETVQRALLGISKGVTGFRRHGIDRVKVDVDDAVVMADAGLLERVLANLIDNALRYAPDSPVRVTAGQVGDRVLIAVVDEGPGIPRGTEEQMFAPFQRLGDHDNSIGVGLGLSVARGFVEAMGGTISATDTPGGGLTVEIDLGCTDRTSRHDSAKTRVLVIDDEPQILRALRINLSVRGYEVVTAADAVTGAARGRRAPARRRRARPRAARHVGHRGARRAARLADGAGDRAVGAHRLRRTRSRRSTPAPTTTSPNPLAWTSSWPGCAPRCAAAPPRPTPTSPSSKRSSFTVDLAAKKVTKNGTEVHLTPTEWGMLEMLVRNRGKLVGREELLKEVWGPAYAKETHYLRVYLAQLRRKLEDDPSHPVHLLTEAGMGYRFEV